MMIHYLKSNIIQCIRFARQQKRFGEKYAFFHAIFLIYTKLEIPFVEYTVTTRCTLKCKHCSNLIPHIKSKKDIAFDKAKKEVDLLLSCVDYVYRFKIHGGEPFLYNNLEDLIYFLNQQKKIGEIQLSTNGTILPNHKILIALKKANVLVYVSGYPSNVAPHREELLKVLREYQIRFRDLNEQKWSDTGSVEKRSRTLKAQLKLTEICSMANCKSLSNYSLYLCSRCSNGEKLGYFEEKNKACLTGNKKIVKKKIRKLYSMHPTVGCEHCDGVIEGRNTIPSAIQMEVING